MWHGAEFVSTFDSLVVEETCLWSVLSPPSFSSPVDCPGEALVFFRSLFDLHWISVSRPAGSNGALLGLLKTSQCIWHHLERLLQFYSTLGPSHIIDATIIGWAVNVLALKVMTVHTTPAIFITTLHYSWAQNKPYAFVSSTMRPKIATETHQNKLPLSWQLTLFLKCPRICLTVYF